MDKNTAKDGNTPKALEPIQRATVEEIGKYYHDDLQTYSWLCDRVQLGD